jgi:hypothetical protein
MNVQKKICQKSHASTKRQHEFSRVKNIAHAEHPLHTTQDNN